MDDKTPLAKRRERGMDDLAAVVQALYGNRCTRKEGGCASCAVWAIFDALDTMTDSSVFADELKRPDRRIPVYPDVPLAEERKMEDLVNLVQGPMIVTIMAGDRWALRITENGITANPEVPTDEAAKAVIDALAPYIKAMMPQPNDDRTDLGSQP